MVPEIELKTSRAEIVAVELLAGRCERVVIAVGHVPPLTRTWNREEHYRMKNETLVILQDLLKRKSRILICGDYQL